MCEGIHTAIACGGLRLLPTDSGGRATVNRCAASGKQGACHVTASFSADHKICCVHRLLDRFAGWKCQLASDESLDWLCVLHNNNYQHWLHRTTNTYMANRPSVGSDARRIYILF